MEQRILTVRVVPRASKSEIIGAIDNVLKVRIAAPPVDGAANEALIKLLAKALGIPKGGVEILSGGTGRVKRVGVTGASDSAIDAVLRAQTSRDIFPDSN